LSKWKPPLDAAASAIHRQRVRQGQASRGRVRHLHLPALACFASGDGFGVLPDRRDLVPHASFGRLGTVRAAAPSSHVARPDRLLALTADLQESVDVLFDQDRHDRSVQFLCDGDLSPAGSWRRRQSVDSRLGLRQAALQRRGLALGQGRGADDLHPLGPDVFLGRRSDRSGLHAGEFVSCPDAFLVLMEVAQLGRLFAGDGRLDPVGELSRNVPVKGSRVR